MAVTVPYIQRCKSEHILYPKAKSEQEMFACGCSLYYKACQDYSYTFRIEALLFASKCFHSLLLFEVSHSYLVSPVHPGSWNAQAQNVLHFWWYTCLKIHFFFFPVDELIFDVKFFFFFFFFPRVNHWSFMLCSQEIILTASRRKENVELLFPGHLYLVCFQQ